MSTSASLKNAKSREDFEKIVQSRRMARMASVDALPPEIRALIHQYGLMVVDAFLRIGITKPNHIRHLVETVLDEFSPTRGSSSIQGIKTVMHRSDFDPGQEGR